MATLKDVAKLAGVSPSTVSRTLSGTIFVEEKTRERVMKAVEELQYHPSMTARALKAGKSYTFALMVPDINSLYYPEIMRSMEKYAAEQGYTILLCNNSEDLEKERRSTDLMISKGVDGIFCMSVSDDISHLAEAKTGKGVPVVMVNRPGGGVLSSVSIDDEYGGYLMTRHLLDLGHTRIAAMFGNFELERFRSRYRGCKRAMEEAGVKGFKRHFGYDIGTLDEAYVRTKELLDREDRPTAFFAAMDVLTIGIYSAIADSGLRIPEDVSVVGFDDIFMTKYMSPPLTTYHSSIDRLAKQAVELLMREVEDPSVPAKSVIMKGSLTVRRSADRPADDRT